jgi:hypothetical protein
MKRAAALRQRCREQLITEHWVIQRDYEHCKGRAWERQAKCKWGRMKQSSNQREKWRNKDRKKEWRRKNLQPSKKTNNKTRNIRKEDQRSRQRQKTPYNKRRRKYKNGRKEVRKESIIHKCNKTIISYCFLYLSSRTHVFSIQLLKYVALCRSVEMYRNSEHTGNHTQQHGTLQSTSSSSLHFCSCTSAAVNVPL